MFHSTSYGRRKRQSGLNPDDEIASIKSRDGDAFMVRLRGKKELQRVSAEDLEEYPV